MLLLATVGVPMLSFLAVDSRIQGKVFRDFDADGVLDTSPIEIGVPGVTVTAYSPTGTVISTTTGADGTYSLTTVTGTKYRIEFTGLQTGDHETGIGTSNGTSVQFAASGDIDVNLGVNYPAEYSSTLTPNVITSGFISGDQVGTDYATNMVWSVPFNANLIATKQNMGTAAQYGSVYGSAHSKKTKKLYLAAYTKTLCRFWTRQSWCYIRKPAFQSSGECGLL